MRALAWLRLAVVLFIVQGVALAAEEAPAPLKVLFVGNSCTATNNLPAMLEGLADAAGGRKIAAERQLVGGCTLQRHVQQKGALDKIRSQKWDVVVLQEHSQGPIRDLESMQKYARLLDAAIKQQGAKTVFYLTWARQHIPEMQQGADPAASPNYAQAMYQLSGAAKSIGFDAWCREHKTGLEGGLNGGYFSIARQLGAQVAPVGIAWQKALAADPPFVLHVADKSHPNRTGTYLAACVFYATLLGESPVGLPGEIKQGNRALVDLSQEEAKRLQEIAEAAVRSIEQPASKPEAVPAR